MDDFGPTRKISAGGAAGAGVTVFVWTINKFLLPDDKHVTPEIAAALTTLVMFVVGWLTPEAKTSGEKNTSRDPEPKQPIPAPVPAVVALKPSPARSTERKEKREWPELLAVLQQRVPAGQVTTYGNCSEWLFDHRSGSQAVNSMLNAMVRANRGNCLWTNRVVRDDGELLDEIEKTYGQRTQLAAEGVPFNDPTHVAFGPDFRAVVLVG